MGKAIKNDPLNLRIIEEDGWEICKGKWASGRLGYGGFKSGKE